MIEVNDIHKAFGSQKVLEGVSCRINKGESIVVIGRSGCGKSVFFKHLVGLITPDSGKVLVDGRDLCKLSERELLVVRRKFGVLFQSAALFDSMTVEENVAFVLNRERKLTPGEISRRVAETLEMVELPGTEKKKPAELSGGMRKRVGLARAIIYQPEIILYDEPTTGLDPVVSDSIDRLIIRVSSQLKITSIAVTHDPRSMRRIGKRIIMLVKGKIYTDGATEDVFASTDRTIHNFVNGISEHEPVAS